MDKLPQGYCKDPAPTRVERTGRQQEKQDCEVPEIRTNARRDLQLFWPGHEAWRPCEVQSHFDPVPWRKGPETAIALRQIGVEAVPPQFVNLCDFLGTYV